MKDDERKWVEDAMLLVKQSSEKGIVVYFVRHYECEPDYVITNGGSAGVIAAMAGFIEKAEAREMGDA